MSYTTVLSPFPSYATNADYFICRWLCLNWKLWSKNFVYLWSYQQVSLVSLGVVALVHTKPASTRTSCYSCYAQGHHRRDTLQWITVMFRNNIYSKCYQQFYKCTIKSPSTTHTVKLKFIPNNNISRTTVLSAILLLTK